MKSISINRQFGMSTVAALAFAILATPLFAQSNSKELAGWANTPTGQVWLRPGRDAYEHNTGLVRDLQTGVKTLPIRPSSLPQAPQVVVTPTPIYAPQPVIVTPQPVYSPQPIVVSPPVYAPAGPACPSCPNYRPNPYNSPGYRYDVGPYGNTVGQNYGLQPNYTQPLRNSYSRIK